MERLLRKLRFWLEDQHTDLDLTDSLIGYLDSWRSSTPWVVGSQDISDPTFQQNPIGDSCVMDGWLSQSWADIQQEHYTNCRSRCTGKRWLIAVIKKLWDVSWNLWSHRNGILHEKTNCVTQSSQKQLHQRVTRLYQELRHHRNTDTKHFTFLSLRRLLTKDTVYLSVWLRQIIAVLKRFQDRPRRSLMHMHHIMQSWLSKKPSAV